MSKQSSAYSRRHVTICREGWYYLAVLTFISAGAVLRQVNPLFALTALMIGPILLNWRISMTSLNQLAIRRRFPDRISAGEDLRIDIVAENKRRRLDSFTIHISDQLALVEPPVRTHRAKAECMIARVPARNNAIASYRCYLNRRGRYRFGPMKYRTRFPLGLVQASRIYRKADELIVAPRLGKLTPSWTNLVYLQQTGQQFAASRHGTHEGDFFALRQWQSGDSKRWIHWRTSARLGELMVKQFEQQSERDLTIVLDAFQNQEMDDSEQDRIELAASFVTTAVMESFQNTSGNITLGIAGRESECLSSQNTTSFRTEALTRLALFSSAGTTDLDRTIATCLQQAVRGSRIVVVTTRSLKPEHLIGPSLEAAEIGAAELAARLIVINVSEKSDVERLIRFDDSK